MYDTRKNATDILESVNILYQNGDIDIQMRNKIVKMVKTSLTTNNYTELNSLFRNLSYGIVMKSELNRLIQLTSENRI